MLSGSREPNLSLTFVLGEQRTRLTGALRIFFTLAYRNRIEDVLLELPHFCPQKSRVFARARMSSRRIPLSSLSCPVARRRCPFHSVRRVTAVRTEFWFCLFLFTPTGFRVYDSIVVNCRKKRKARHNVSSPSKVAESPMEWHQISFRPFFLNKPIRYGSS